jgi:sigma-E factor negative regulatory protein RseC
MTRDIIHHVGKIDRIDKNKAYVRIEQKTACNDCHAKSSCLAFNRKEKIIEVNDYSGDYSLQESVIVSVRSSMGLFAVILAFAVPLLLVVFTLVAGIALSGSEVVGGLTGLSVLVPYYLILYLLRDKIKRKIKFTLSKNQELPSSSTLVTNHL